MTNISAPRDNNRVPSLIGVSSLDGKTPVVVYVDPTTHRVLVDVGGGAGYVYIAYASDALGTDFTLTFNASLDYIAILSSETAILNPQASDFAGLWKNYKGAPGANGTNGTNGTNGIDGVSFIWMSDYSGATAYVPNDVVYYNGSAYICILASTNNLPTNTTYWHIMAAKGADGSGTGDVLGPATNTDSYIPQWNGANSKTLKNGLAVPAGGLAGLTALGLKEDSSNKVTSISSSSTDVQYPSAKVVYDNLGLKQTAFPGIDETTPVTISIDYSTRVLTLTPTGSTFNVFTDGNGVINKYVKTGAVSFPAFTDTNGIWYFSFDQSGNPVVSQTPPSSYRIYAPVYRILWNNTLSGSAKSITEAYEIHPNNIPGVDHDWKHQYGAIWSSGGVLANTAISSGTPNVSGVNTCVSLTTISNMDDNLQYTITNSAGGSAWQQDLGNTTPANITISNGALLPIRYQNSGGVQFVLPATRFPFDFTGNTPNYITSTGARTPVDNNYYFVYFISCIQDPRNGMAVKLWSAPAEYSTLTNARSVSWSDIDAIYSVASDHEVRPLYKLIFEYRNGYDVAIKGSALREVQDLRVAQVISSTSAIGSMPASSVTFVPAGNISSTNVQSAIEELDTEKVATTVTVNGHALSSNITVTASDVGLGNVDNTSDATKNSATATITNKRNQKRVYSTTSNTSLTPEIDTYDIFIETALAGAITINNHSTSTPVNGEMILIDLLDNGTPRAITWGNEYNGVCAALPPTTIANKRMLALFKWNSSTSKNDLISLINGI